MLILHKKLSVSTSSKKTEIGLLKKACNNRIDTGSKQNFTAVEEPGYLLRYFPKRPQKKISRR